MEKDRNGNYNDKTDLTQDSKKDNVDKAYYKDLYNDLPGEVVDILMKTHPLMGKQEEDASISSSTKGQDIHEDDTRKKTVKEEQKHEVDAEEKEYIPKRKKDETSNVLEETESVLAEKKHKSTMNRNTMDYEDEDDRIQFVQMKVKVKQKPSPMDNIEEPSTKKKRKSKKKSKENYYDTYPEDIDFAEKEKEENLACLYSDEDFEDEKFELDKNKKTLLVVCGVAVFVVGVLLFQSISLKGKLSKAQEEIATFQDVSSKYEELQMEKLTLEDEINALRNGEPIDSDKTKDASDKKTSDTKEKSNGEYEIYVTKPNDTFWDIAQSVYGNGAYYTKILEANGLQESDPIHEGQELKIPKQ